MRIKRFASMLVACVLFIGSFIIPVNAMALTTASENKHVASLITPMATNSFNMSIPAQTKALANSSFPLAAGETVTIKASYSPFSASVDIGLIAPDGTFYYFNITNGSIDKTIQVDESGSYTLQVRNNANFEIEVSGFVNY